MSDVGAQHFTPKVQCSGRLSQNPLKWTFHAQPPLSPQQQVGDTRVALQRQAIGTNTRSPPGKQVSSLKTCFGGTPATAWRENHHTEAKKNPIFRFSGAQQSPTLTSHLSLISSLHGCPFSTKLKWKKPSLVCGSALSRSPQITIQDGKCHELCVGGLCL